MRTLVLALSFLALATPAFAQKGGGDAGVEDRIIQYADSDQRMNDAIAEARSTLPLFMAELQRTPEGQRSAFSLKVGLDAQGGGREHIWIDNLHYEGSDLVGALANVPDALPGMQLGSRVVIEEERISDWMIQSRQGLYGAYTVRVMVQDMTPQEAAGYRAMLAPTPLPPGWTQ